MDLLQFNGNLTMSQVFTMFHRLILEHKDPLASETVGRKYGRVVTYSDDERACNPNLRSAIVDFLSGAEPIPEGARADLDTKVGDNITLLLIRAENVQNLGEKNEVAMDSDLSTHWTTLNLRKNEGRIEVRYADSIGYHNGRDSIPNAVKRALENAKINLDTSIQNFTSTPQTGSNCGYMAVWHALLMHGVNVFAHGAEEFVQSQRDLLYKEQITNFNVDDQKKNFNSTYFTLDQLRHIEAKKELLLNQYPQYAQLICDSVEVMISISPEDLPILEWDSISYEGKRYLSSEYQTHFLQLPSLFNFFIDRLYESAITNKILLQNIRQKIMGSVALERMLLENLFFRKEITVDIIAIEKALFSLLNLKVFETPPTITSSARLLNQIVFSFGAPFAKILDPNGDIKPYYNRMISQDSYAGEVLESLLDHPEQLSVSLRRYFNNLAVEMKTSGIHHSETTISKICEILIRNCEVYYQRNPTLFIMFKPKFDLDLASEEEKKLIREANDDSIQGLTDLTNFLTTSDISSPNNHLLSFSRSESKALAVIEKLTRCNAEPLSQLSLALLKLINKFMYFPETEGFWERLPILNLSLKLLTQHYQMGESPLPFQTGNTRRDLVLGITFEAFLLKSGKDMFDLQKYSERLRVEIKELKSRRHINEKVAKYFTSRLHERILHCVKHYLEPFHDELADIVPYAVAQVKGNNFLVLEGLQQVIAKTSEIAQHFQRRYLEIDEEITTLKEQEEEKERIQAKELLERLEKEVIEQKAFYTKLELDKKALHTQWKDRMITKYGDHALKELSYRLKGDTSRHDSTYNREQYKILITEKLYNLINTGGSNFMDDVQSAIENGFIGTGGKGRSGIKPIDHSEKVDGYVVVEVKLTGSKLIKLQDYINPIEMGDIRLCGVVKNGVFLIVAFSRHGKNNEELFNTIQDIKVNIKNGKIQIIPSGKTIPPGDRN